MRKAPRVKERYAGWLHVRVGGRMTVAARWRDVTGTRRKEEPWLNGRPRLIFVSDMSDSLSAAVPFDFLEKEIVNAVTSTEGLRYHWLWLTKRPDRMPQFSDLLRTKGIDWEGNLWAGARITTQTTTSRVARRAGRSPAMSA